MKMLMVLCFAVLFSSDGLAHYARPAPFFQQQFQHQDDSEGKIVGGTEADIKEVPWQVALITVDNKLIGSGTIISKKLVLTSPELWNADSTTLLDMRVKDLFVRSGSSFYNMSGCRHEVTEILFPPKLRLESKYDHYFALLVVFPSFEFSETTQKVNLNSNEDYPVNKMLTISGWGSMKEDHIYSHKLKKTEVKVVLNNNKDCPGMGYWMEDKDWTDTMMCTLNGDRLESYGDGGGPLSDLKGKILYGVNFQFRNRDKSKPSIFSNVAKEKEWINNWKAKFPDDL